MSYVTNTGQYPRYEELKKFVMSFYEQQPSMHNGGQYALQGAKETDGQYCCVHEKFGGTFKGFDDSTHKTVLDIFKNTEIELLFDYINKYNPCRSRIFVLGKNKSDYSIHRDPCKRIHVPIVTNSSCTFHWFDEDHNEIHRDFLEADGSIYLVDTTTLHKTQNTESTDRIHIVCSYYD